MVNLGDLTKLLSHGHLTDEYILKSAIGEYKFVFRTLTPYEDVETNMVIKDVLDKQEDEGTKITLMALETLARAIISVNDLPLESIPGAEGDSTLDKRRDVVKKLSRQAMLALWSRYLRLLEKTAPQNTPEEEEAIKKP
jgi:hypothetical protein